MRCIQPTAACSVCMGNVCVKGAGRSQAAPSDNIVPRCGPVVRTLGCDRLRHARAAGLLGERVAGGQRGHLGAAAGRGHAGALLRAPLSAAPVLRAEHLVAEGAQSHGARSSVHRNALLCLLSASAKVTSSLIVGHLSAALPLPMGLALRSEGCTMAPILHGLHLAAAGTACAAQSCADEHSTTRRASSSRGSATRRTARARCSSATARSSRAATAC